MLDRLAGGFRRLADGVAALLLAVIFVAFILQIVLRYVFNWPVGWTTEISLMAWLWLILWGTSFVLKDEEEIRIDLAQELLGPRARDLAHALGSSAMVVLLGMSLPAAYDYVAFMRVEKSSYMGIRFDVLFSVYLVFSLAVMGRHLRQLYRLVSGRAASDTLPSKAP
jgi:TRAP-type C4-dicarboxylate transport system permease small subunit